MRRAAVATALRSSATRIRRRSGPGGIGLGLLALVALAACGPPGGTGNVRAGQPSSTTPSSTIDESATTTTSSSTTTSTTSTSSTTTTTTLPPAAGTPAPTTWHFEGRHAGTEHFELNTGRCAFLDHELEETFTLVDGTEWSFRSEYCGTVDATGMWSGAGTFAIRAGDGSTLAGTTANTAQLPSVGEPYTLDIHSGSGQFEGATGTCALDNHLREIEFGVQEQWGTFVCDLHR